MRLLAELGYVKILFPKECNYSAIIEALGDAQEVEEVGPWGNRVLQAKSNEDTNISIKLINDEDTRLPSVDKSAELEALLKIAAERDELRRKVGELEAKLKKLTDVVSQ